jgi:hypothetical protein
MTRFPSYQHVKRTLAAELDNVVNNAQLLISEILAILQASPELTCTHQHLATQLRSNQNTLKLLPKSGLTKFIKRSEYHKLIRLDKTENGDPTYTWTGHKPRVRLPKHEPVHVTFDKDGKPGLVGLRASDIKITRHWVNGRPFALPLDVMSCRMSRDQVRQVNVDMDALVVVCTMFITEWDRN